MQLTGVDGNAVTSGGLVPHPVAKVRIAEQGSDCHSIGQVLTDVWGMMMHRWWGNKFSKRGCKKAYPCEDRHALSGWVIPRLFTFGRSACLAAAVAVAVLKLPVAFASAAPGEGQPAAGASVEFEMETGTLYVDWAGPIVAGMADDLRATVSQRVALFLDSRGGRVEEGDRVIEVLNEIKLRHQLITVVPHGKLCASMCIPIFLQGEERLAARASLWIFHEAAQRQANGQERTDIVETWRLFRKRQDWGDSAEPACPSLRRARPTWPVPRLGRKAQEHLAWKSGQQNEAPRFLVRVARGRR
jgi:hypothetical protein